MNPQNETDLFRQAAHEDRDLEELQAEALASRPSSFGIPIEWGERGGPVVRSHGSVVAPTRDEVSSYGTQQVQATCGSCHHYDVELGRKKMIEERFGERLVREEEWQLRHLGVPIDNLALCGLTSGADIMVVTLVSPACDQYRQRSTRAGRFRL